MTKTLRIATPHGEFTRKTKTAYTHAIVRQCARAEAALTADRTFGVSTRWKKDRGYAVTWHGSEQAARTAAAKPYLWGDSIVLGIYPVEG